MGVWYRKEIDQSSMTTRPESRKISPEPRIAVFGGLAAFAWEMWQMPFYETAGMSYLETVAGCSLASVGDAGIMVFAYWTTARIMQDRFWLFDLTKKSVLLYLAIGEIVTIAIEHIALNVRFGWRYADAMPNIPLLGIGAAPFIMWLVIPTVALFLARWGVKHR